MQQRYKNKFKKVFPGFLTFETGVHNIHYVPILTTEVNKLCKQFASSYDELIKHLHNENFLFSFLAGESFQIIRKTFKKRNGFQLILSFYFKNSLSYNFQLKDTAFD